MIQGNLDTTNLLLGIMAAISVLEALVLIGAGIMAYRLYNAAMQTIKELEQRQVAPLVARVNGILDDVKGVTRAVSEQTDRVDHAIRSTLDRVDETADRVRTSVREQAGRAIGLIRGIRSAIAAVLSRQTVPRHPAEASGRL